MAYIRHQDHPYDDTSRPHYVIFLFISCLEAAVHQYVAKEMRSEIMTFILTTSSKFSVLIHESTSV